MKNSEKSLARQSALKALYEREFSPAQTQPGTKNNKDGYINHLLQGVHTHKKEIDKLIKQSSQFWKMDRIALIDLNIMRIAIYEMLYSTPPVPFKVCIDEAVKMAKLYGTADSSKFINGNLDAIFKNRENNKPPGNGKPTPHSDKPSPRQKGKTS